MADTLDGENAQIIKIIATNCCLFIKNDYLCSVSLMVTKNMFAKRDMVPRRKADYSAYL